ncbi:pectinesterase [Bryocella elongata]|uniref:Pectinesterase n=1 Tax=Bryocella elongata TaxID=863522 RepID=A0A1H5TF24_9BACT|nr:pectinesterase family protein [Bryocella elongata]SEF61435.1 pectinesterase [Bryocella elongata]
MPSLRCLSFATLCLFALPVAASAATKPTTVVAVDGSGQFKTVQAAVDSATDAGLILQIEPGTYREKIRIARNGIELRGMGRKPDDVVLVWDDSAKSAGGTGKSYSVQVTGDDFRAENLTIQNDWEKKNARVGEGSQAVALSISGDREVLGHVRLLGYQDTLYAASNSCHAEADATAAQASGKPCHASRQLFQDCYIEGHVDFIFGDAKAVFDHCELHGMTHTVVALTAQSRLYPLEDSGYLFLHTKVTADVAVDKLSFGRPWRAYARVYFVDTTVSGTVIEPEGWIEWGGRLATSDYAEFNTRDSDGTPARIDKRLAPSRQLTRAEAAKLTVNSWLEGPDGWKPESK